MKNSKKLLLVFAIFVFMAANAFSSSADCIFPENGLTICYQEKIQPYNTTLPMIKVDFFELPVQIKTFKLMNLNDSENRDIELVESIGGKNFTFKPYSHLPNRKYLFFLNVTDIDGNVITMYNNFSINVNQIDVWVTKPGNNYVQKPDFAIAPTEVFNLELQLERAGNCGYRTSSLGNQNLSHWYNGRLTYFEPSDLSPPNSKRVMLKNFNFSKFWPGVGLDGEGPLGNYSIMYVVCKENNTERYAYQEIKIGVDLTAPDIKLNAIPSPVIDFNLRNTSLNITLDDRSVCTVDDVVHPRGYRVTKVHGPGYPYSSFSDFKIVMLEEILFPQEVPSFEYELNVTCQNLANRENSKKIKVPVNLQTEQNIQFHSPNSLESVRTVDINISTAISDLEGCKYSISGAGTYQSGDFSRSSSSGSRIEYHKKVTLSEGKNRINATCAPIWGVPSTKEVLVDTTGPTQPPSIDANSNTCSLQKLQATLKNGTDNANGSGFDYFEYNITLQGDSANKYGFYGTTPGPISKDISKFKNITGLIYTIKAWSVDKAGNKGQVQQKQVTVTNSSIKECDFDNPSISVKSKKDNVTNFWSLSVNCSDIKSGCEPNFKYSIHLNSKENCSYNMSKLLLEPVIIQNSSKFCAIVFDRNQNNASFTDTYDVIYPISCSNGVKDGTETAKDCGGKCPPCDINRTCLVNSDCVSGYCRNGICSVPSCTDNITNGKESGVDCGGESNCGPCPIGFRCIYASDCASRNCENGSCRPASCTNNKVDGTESDFDCGGSCPKKCANGFICKSKADCVSNYCDAGKCALDPALDTDGDGLPDYWELKYCQSETGCEPNEDLDGDRYTNLEEYENNTNPIDPDSFPDFHKLNLISVILLVVGFLLAASGAAILLTERNKKNQASAEKENASFRNALYGGPKPVILHKEEEKRKFTSQELAARDKLSKNAIKMKENTRKNIFDEFTLPGQNSSADRNAKSYPQPVVKSQVQPPTRVSKQESINSSSENKQNQQQKGENVSDNALKEGISSSSPKNAEMKQSQKVQKDNSKNLQTGKQFSDDEKIGKSRADKKEDREKKIYKPKISDDEEDVFDRLKKLSERKKQ